MNAVIYARFSSHNQTEQSIEGQLKTCYEFAQKNGYTIVGEYIDRAISGTTDARPDFLRMIEDSAKKGFQYVLVYQLDRFARNRYDSATYKAKLKKNGVRVLSARENITDDASGILVEGLLESMAEYYSAELAQKIRRGMAINAEKCLANGSNPGLGFKVAPDKHYIIDEETAPIVVRIFEEYAAGKTVTEICESLNNQGVRTSRGAMFNKNSLRKMLQNKRYIGYYLYKDIETPGGMPRIISDDLFYKVQEIMTKNRKAPARTKAKQEYLLTTKLFCGKCRDMMTGVKGTSHTGAAYYYYKCNNAKKKQCDKKAVQKDYIEDLVIAECRKQLTPANIDKIAHEVVALCEREKDNTNLRRIEKLMRENERKQRNLMSAVAECDIDSVRKSLYVEIARLTTELDTLKNEYAIEQAGAVSLTITEVKFFLTQLRKGRADDISYRKTLINVFVNAIYLYDDKLVIFFNSGDKPVTIDDELLDQIENSAGFVFGALGSTKNKGHPLGGYYFLVRTKIGSRTHFNATVLWTVARDGLTERHHNETTPLASTKREMRERLLFLWRLRHESSVQAQFRQKETVLIRTVSFPYVLFFDFIFQRNSKFSQMLNCIIKRIAHSFKLIFQIFRHFALPFNNDSFSLTIRTNQVIKGIPVFSVIIREIKGNLNSLM